MTRVGGLTRANVIVEAITRLISYVNLCVGLGHTAGGYVVGGFIKRIYQSY